LRQPQTVANLAAMTALVALGPRGEITIRMPNADERQLQTLLERVKAVVCRPEPGPDYLELGAISVDFVRREIRGGRQGVRLTAQEFDLLRYLALRRNGVVTRQELLHTVWRYAATPVTRSVDNAIARLRKKIEPCPRNPVFIHTVHGDGYCLVTRARSQVAIGGLY
jgi:DNA-binding response OmpR family regulator